MIYTGNTDRHTPYIGMVIENTLSLKEKSSLKDINLAVKSRPMKSLSDFQQRKYGTVPSIVGIQGDEEKSMKAIIRVTIFNNAYF